MNDIVRLSVTRYYFTILDTMSFSLLTCLLTYLMFMPIVVLLANYVAAFETVSTKAMQNFSTCR